MDEKETNKLITALLVVAVILMAFNTYTLSLLQSGSDVGSNTAGAGSDVMPTGVPKIYGKELGISYDGVSASNPQLADQTIAVMGNLDRTLTLEGADLQRYIKILYTQEGGTSCEYCCGAQSIIFQNGQAACGCAHSYAMRGLAKYLLLNHGKEMSDDQILEEVGKWKVLFFPTQMTLKAQTLASQGIETSYINIASNKYRGIEKGQSANGGGMVGGC